jgi:hypothetical protein
MKKFFWFILYIFIISISYSQTNGGDKIEENVIAASDSFILSQKQMVKGTDVYLTVEEMPSYPGGAQALLKDIEGNMIHTKNTKDAKGSIFLQCVIDADGKINNPIVIMGLSACKECNEVVLNALKKLKPFAPGKQNGKTVKVRYDFRVKLLGSGN